MLITVIAIGTLAIKVGRNHEIELPEGATIADVKEALGLMKNYPICQTINEVKAARDTVLVDGDKVKLMNVVSAG